MRYYVSFNIQQNNQLKELEEYHKRVSTNGNDDFYKSLKEFVSKVRKTNRNCEPYLYPLTECINQIIFSFNEFKEAINRQPSSSSIDDFSKTVEESSKKELAMLFVFFLNSKAFLDLISKYSAVGIKDNYDLYKGVKKIRDLLIHFYEKEIDERKFFVSLFVQRGLSDLSQLDMTDIHTREVESIFFSIDAFYYSLQNIFRNFMSSLEN